MSKKKQSDPAEAEQKAPETPSEDETAKAAAQEEQAAPAENWKATRQSRIIFSQRSE